MTIQWYTTRADLKQWIGGAVGVAGDVSLFCQALSGNASDKVTLVATVEALAEQLRTEDETVMGLFIELAFIATFTQRFFTR